MLAPARTSAVETHGGGEVQTRRPGCSLFELAVQFGEARQHMEAVAEAPMAAAHPGGGDAGLVALAMQVQQDMIASEEPPRGFENADDTVFPRGLAALSVWQGSAAPCGLAAPQTPVDRMAVVSLPLPPPLTAMVVAPAQIVTAPANLSLSSMPHPASLEQLAVHSITPVVTSLSSPLVTLVAANRSSPLVTP